ncbi:S41 family peptidase [Haloplasma contractile]|uniref:Membrane lipoprotein n=1 Tax=Haloplasma contractile SSD-17B TaxID=1033810 RepID=U2FQ74_9MOLU|nr:S41 family peptidase [Haloplasma contractile]ERJ13194.1 membrane lipoprotein [Haloplasma contractile SSD-17B]
MKKLKSIIILSLIILLAGCSFIYETDKIDSDITEETKEKGTTEDDTNSEPDVEIIDTISKDKVLNVIDIAPEFIIDSNRLTTYKYSEDPHVSYININEFVTFMGDSIVDLIIAKDDPMTISYVYEVPTKLLYYYGGYTYTYEMTLDADTEQITYNDFNMLSSLDVPKLSTYSTNLSRKDFHMVNENPAVTIDLSEYNMDIVRYEGNYYIPLYLANLFLTGSYINVYEMNDILYVFDNFTELNELTNNFIKDESMNALNLNAHVENYLALYFDYFYGLKEYKEVESFKTTLDSYELNEQDSFHLLHNQIDWFIKSQNDLHTKLISGGYMNQDYVSTSYESDKRSQYQTAYYNNNCSYNNSEISHKGYGNIYVIEINRFSLNTRSLLKPAMDAAKSYEHIIIDVGCNPGGNLVGVLELLSYVTDEDITFSYINPITGSKTTKSYGSSVNQYLDKNFYVFTTAASYSAANLFTSIVKDEELAVIFGEDTSGGACAITFTVLPDGAILVNSSNFALINKNNELIEDGIEVHYEVEYPIDWDTITDDLDYMRTR